MMRWRSGLRFSPPMRAARTSKTRPWEASRILFITHQQVQGLTKLFTPER